MNEEEKKAIKGLEWSQQQMRLGNLPDYNQGHYADIKIILNLIERRQKIIEELENADLTTVYFNGFYDGEKKMKDKIKAKIEEINEILHNHILIEKLKVYYEAQKEVLQSFLESEKE